MTSKAGAINPRPLLRVLEELADEGASGLLTEEAKSSQKTNAPLRDSFINAACVR